MTAENTFAIGAVSRLLGLSTHTLRKWEVRHGAVTPGRSKGGDRRYSRQDLQRLTKLRDLVERGHAISTIASLSTAELDDLLGTTLAASTSDAESLRVAVLGDRLWRELYAARERLQQTELVAHAESAEHLSNAAAEALVVDFPALADNTRAELRSIREQTGIDRLLVVYRYGSIDTAERLCDARTAAFSRPLNLREMERALLSIAGDQHSSRPTLGLPPHRFSRTTLAEVASTSPALACECPRHVAELIIELSDFESYSEDCEINKPEDAVVHGMLRRTAATARSVFEDALIDLAAYEGIELVPK